MSKYVIEIEDVPFSKVRFDDYSAQNINLYRAKGFNALVFDKDGLDKLTPLDKELEETYQKGLDNAWECAKRLVWETSFNEAKSMGFIVEEETAEILRDYTATAATKAVELYDEKQLKAEINIGDEVIALHGKAIVIDRFTDKDLNLNGTPEEVCEYWYYDKGHYDERKINLDRASNLRKTGRYFPQVVELIKAIKGE